MRKKKELHNPEKLQLTLRNAFLLQRENVVFTSHIGFFSKEALMRILETTAVNIRNFMSGNPSNAI